MINIRLMALIMDGVSEALGQPHLSVDLSQQEGPKVRGQGPALEIGTKGLPGDGRKAQLF